MISLIISTFNRPIALDLVFQSIAKQTALPDEIIVADDGSTNLTEKLIDRLIDTYDFPIRHVWQEDWGFRLSKIRNEAIKDARGKYLIFIDGDILLHPRFIESHKINKRKRYYLQGSRVLINKKLSNQIIDKKKLKKILFFSNHIRNRMNTLHSGLLSQYVNSTSSRHDNVRGCHMSFWKDDLMNVNGFNEDFNGWGKEDNELIVRLFNTGIKRINLNFCAVAYHLYHDRQLSKTDIQANEQILSNTINNNLMWCENGILKNTKGHLS